MASQRGIEGDVLMPVPAGVITPVSSGDWARALLESDDGRTSNSLKISLQNGILTEDK